MEMNVEGHSKDVGMVAAGNVLEVEEGSLSTAGRAALAMACKRTLEQAKSQKWNPSRNKASRSLTKRTG